MMEHISPAVLEHALAECRKENEELIKALRHILWIKDCGVHGQRYEGGPCVNHPDVERDAMYQIATEALAHHAAKVAPTWSGEKQ